MTQSFRLFGILAAVSVFALAILMFLPQSTSAAGANELIKCSDSSAVYLLGEDGKRYAFPNERIYFTWHEGFDQVNEVSCADLSAVAYGGVVRYRPGVRLIKIPSVPVVYAVESNGVLRPIKSEEQARKLYGDDWATRVDDLSEAFFPRYTLGAQLATDELPEGMILEDESGLLVQVDEDGELIEVEGVLSSRDKALMRRHAHKLSSLERRIGRAMSRISDLESQIERLQRQLRRQKAVHVDNGSRKSRVHIESEKKTDDDSGSSAREEGMPDFVVTDIAVSSSGAITATVANQGTADSPSDMGVYFYFDEVLEWTYSTSTLSNRDLLNMGGSSTISPQGIMGEREIEVCADALSQVSELDESNNCRTETLSAPDGTFDLLTTQVDAIDALGYPDETVRSFGFTTNSPLDHYRIRVWDANGNLHDEFLQQIIGQTTLQAFYVSPSWLTPLSTNSTYSWEIHAEEYGTGDADAETGTFTTGTNSSGAALDIAFTQASGSVFVNPGDTATFGAYTFTATGGDVEVQNIEIPLLILDDIDSVAPFSEINDGFAVAADHFDPLACTLKDTTGNVWAGPDSISGGSLGIPARASFTDDFTVTAGSSVELNLECEFNSVPAYGGSDAFAINLISGSDVVARDSSNNSVAPTISATNGNPPDYRVYLESGGVTLTASLNAGSPSGAAVPSMQEVLRFNLTASTEDGADVSQIYFEFVSTDNSQSDWNTCGYGSKGPLDSDSNFQLLDINDITTDLATGFTFYNTSGVDCDITSGDLGYIAVQLNESISAGTTRTFMLKADTTGASSVDDDAVRADIESSSMFTWFDGLVNQDGTSVVNLPITGGTLVF